MSKRETKLFACLHAPCTFKTDKRKAIYTHLVRTHNERKEDYECEYCNSMFELDDEIERHLHLHHPQQPFTYTCVSRIEKVINKCAKLGSDSSRSNTLVKTIEPVTEGSVNKLSPKVEKPSPKADKKISPISKPTYLKPNISMRTRASVNESLNNLAKQPKQHESETLAQSDGSDVPDKSNNKAADDMMDDIENESIEEKQTFVSKPSGLKIKFSLKKSTDMEDNCSERSSSPPQLELSKPVLDANDAPAASGEAPPDIVRIHNTRGKAQVRMKDSKYYDKLEVYHHTDEQGRRCCPFCDYKTSKNTIRVHLSGIHKMHFVKCSLCDYKAAFPHQITQHGIKFHKTTNLNVIQLSKEYRDSIISKLTTFNHEGIIDNNQNKPGDANKAHASDQAIIDDEDFNSEESYPTSADENDVIDSADDRTYKPPKCQTSKTDYYSIRNENGVYLYSCNLCTFQTPVRATIYTHKYRHEEKSYRCGYCNFTSAPRSNVVHHCRVKHKNSPVNVVENDVIEDGDLTDDIPPAASTEEVPPDINVPEGTVVVKPEPVEDEGQSSNSFQEMDIYTVPDVTMQSHDIGKGKERVEKPQQTIIKVPQFKRSIASTDFEAAQSVDMKKPKTEADVPEQEYKLSLNKLYRINPNGSPKFMCALCSYACDTHPKMKHHLYRHRPQKYKCPYCDHRKYPRSYVVRHVRDTHRNKPVRVIDLSKGNEPEDIPDYMHEVAADDSTTDNIDADTSTDSPSLETSLVKKEPVAEQLHADKSDVIDAMNIDDHCSENEEVKALRNFAQTLNLRSVLTTDLNDDLFNQSPDVSPNFSDAVYTSTPLIESYINGQYNGSNSAKLGNKNFDKKKSLKDYRVNYGQGPRYICNKCGYGTENYKTIHNHMYRHESQRYQCPYCGYRRSPKSFVENHIREVHKGHPVIVTELSVEQELSDTPVGSPRQCVTLKRKDEFSPVLTQATPAKMLKADENADEQSRNLAAHTPTSQAEVCSQAEPSISSAQMPELLLPVQSQDVSDVKAATSQPINAPALTPPFRFIEKNRTTFKTMYKCVFDPETCNHISKDKSKMKQHLFMHVEYKPWSCDFCDMTASQSSHIKNHVRTEHPYVPETSFKYKKHNYLEKHIDGFLTKGLFTVPVNEYRAIMDMKGNTKSTKQPTFARDAEGNLLCPYCSYKTKSGGLTDHVKMKHMQPRFKCHWCDYRAFYRSEVRKHHRKERSHFGLEFKTQELDLVQVMEGYKEQNALSAPGQLNALAALSLDPTQLLDDEDDDDDGRSECSSSDGSSIGDYQQGYAEYTTEQLSELCNRQSKSEDIPTQMPFSVASDSVVIGTLNTEIGPDGSMKIVQSHVSQDNNAIAETSPTKNSKFKCGYCSFSAALRVKVKMHCSKKHTEKVVSVIEPTAKHESMREDNLDLHADDWKGTRFEQDLRKAGVSKLNLASLFPNSKRFQKETTNDVDGDLQADINDNDYVNESAQEATVHEIQIAEEGLTAPENDGEFKKPLEPVSKHKSIEKKVSMEDVKKSVVQTNKKKAAIESADKELGTTRKRSECKSKSNSNGKLSKETPKVSQTGINANFETGSPANVEVNIVVNEKQGTGEGKLLLCKVQTAFPNCTEVILEDDTNAITEETKVYEDTGASVSEEMNNDKKIEDDNTSDSKETVKKAEELLVNGHQFAMDGTIHDESTLDDASSDHAHYEMDCSENIRNGLKQDSSFAENVKNNNLKSLNGGTCILDER